MSDQKNAEQSAVIEETSSKSSPHQEDETKVTDVPSQSEPTVHETIESAEVSPKMETKTEAEKAAATAESEIEEITKSNEKVLSDLQADAAQKAESRSVDSDSAVSVKEKKSINSTKEDGSITTEASDHDKEREHSEQKTGEEKTRNEKKGKTSSCLKEPSDLPQKASGAANKASSQSQPLTIEEKRKQQRENKMTIEEKRRLQKTQAVYPISHHSVIKDYFQKTDQWDRICLIVLLLCEVMTIYISLQVMRYLRALYAIGIFLVLTSAIFMLFWFMTKKKRTTYCCSGILALLLLIGSIGAYRMATFGSHVFNNVETETVMIVTAKDSKLMPSSDFKGKKMAVYENDGELNNFAREILSKEKKSGYQEVAYSSYQEAYTDMQEGRIDMMVYDAQIQKSLEEKGIDSGAHIKVLFEKTFQRAAVKSKAVDISKDPFNVYISGVDLTSRGINEKGSSDVNMILTVNPKTKKMIMQTIPRDSWVPITCMNDRHSKLTYAGAYGGIDCSIQTIEKTYGITINYYAKINFQGVIDLVDALGGVTVISDVGFCEAHPFEGYGVRDYCYAAGPNEVNGIEALMFSRIRRVFSGGDIERGRHQMALVEAVMNKFIEEPTMEHINGLLIAVQNNFTTNLAESDMGKALNLLIRMQDQIQKVEMYTMQGELVWNDDEIRNEHLYYFYPNDGEVAVFQQRIRDVFEGK